MFWIPNRWKSKWQQQSCDKLATYPNKVRQKQAFARKSWPLDFKFILVPLNFWVGLFFVKSREHAGKTFKRRNVEIIEFKLDSFYRAVFLCMYRSLFYWISMIIIFTKRFLDSSARADHAWEIWGRTLLNPLLHLLHHQATSVFKKLPLLTN